MKTPAHRETTTNHGSISAIDYPEFLRRVAKPKSTSLITKLIKHLSYASTYSK